MNNGNIYPDQKPRSKPSKFLNIEYYQSRPKDLVERMLKTGIDISKFYSFELKPIQIVGKFPSASLSRIEFKDEQNNSLGSAVLKQSEASQTKEIIKDKQSSQQKSEDIAEYQFNHLTFGCNHLLPFTQAFDYQILKAEDMDDKADKGKVKVSNILLEYWPEPSLDQNLLYLDSILINYAEKSKDPKKDAAAEKQVMQDIEHIVGLKDNLIKKSIDTIVDIATYGTYFLKNPRVEHDRIKVFQMSDNDKIEKSVKKAQEMGFWLTLYSALVQKTISFEDIQAISFENYLKNPKSLPENVQKNIGDKISDGHTVIGETIPTIIESITDQKNKVYQQGDETPVHMVYRKFGNTLKMGFLDLDRARIDNIYTSFSKACLGSIQNLNSRDMEVYLGYLLKRRKEISNQFAKKEKLDISKIYLEEDFEKSEESFNLISVYELLKIVGKEARFYLKFNKECDESIKNIATISKNFKNKYLELPNSPFLIDSGISYTPYLSQEYIPKAVDLYKERLEVILGKFKNTPEKKRDNNYDKKMNAVFKLYNVCKNNFFNR
jgi:hypothetical protein